MKTLLKYASMFLCVIALGVVGERFLLPPTHQEVVEVSEVAPSTPSIPSASTKPATPSHLDNTTTDWWLKRNPSHQTPGFNDKLTYDPSKYDAYALGDTSQKVIYLTFDEGYENGYTAPILDTLKKTGVKAMFFVTSPYVEQNPDLIKRMVDEGHLVCNHTKSHPSMPKYTSDSSKFNEQLQDVETKYKSITGQDMPKFFRPPMGQYSEKSLAMTQALGYKTIFWSFAYKDFDVNNQPTPEYAKRKILDNLHNGGIFLLHAVSKTNADILEEVLLETQNQGYRFELLK